jgi:hypothetical protein
MNIVLILSVNAISSTNSLPHIAGAMPQTPLLCCAEIGLTHSFSSPDPRLPRIRERVRKTLSTKDIRKYANGKKPLTFLNVDQISAVYS